MAQTLASSGSCVIKAGKNISTDWTAGTRSGSEWDDIINMAEGTVCCASRRDWVAAYSGLSANIKMILDDVTSNLVAMYLVIYDMAGYTSRVEAEDIVNVLRDGALRGLGILRDKKVVDFIDGI